jgi:asparagine synthase (glutamine-hydrolysing)
LKRATYSLDVSERTRRYQQVLSLLPGDQIDELFCDGLLGANAGDAILDSWAELSPLMEKTDELGGFQFVEMRSTLPDELLMYADKLSMAHGLEARVPFLDKELVEYVERLPAQFKVRNGSRKWIHRRVCAEFLPDEFLRRKKRGFAVNAPDAWFRGAVDGTMEETILDSSSCMYQFLRPSAVQEMLRQHKAGKSDFHKILFSLVLFEQWLRVQTQSTSAVQHETVSSW